MSPKDLYTMFIATLFRIDPDWKQPKCSSTAEWINKWWCSYALEYYSSRREERAASLNPSKLETSETELLHSFSIARQQITTNITAKNNIHLLTHNSVGQKSKHRMTGFSVGVLEGWIKVLAGLCLFRRLWRRAFFWAHLGCWLNPVPCSCRMRCLLTCWLSARC